MFWDLGKSSMKFNSERVVSVWLWVWEVLTTWRETFLNVKRNSTQLKDIVSHDEGEFNANYYPKMSLSHIDLGKRSP